VIDSNVARRYASALLSLASNERGPLEKTAEQLSRVANGIANSAAAPLLAPGAPREQQRGVVEALSARLEKPVADLLRLLVDRNRFDGLPQISQAFSTMVLAKLGKVRATVTSAVELDDDQLKEIGAQLAKATGKQISLDSKLDASLLGGVAADVGGLLFDGSLRTQLEKLRQELRGKNS
jgi:F-type H+-transporting ATPase subunit delta